MELAGFNPSLKPKQYFSLPHFPLIFGTGKSVPLPSSHDLWRLANIAWRGSQYKIYDKSNGLFFKGRDFIQWLLYHLAISDTADHTQYAIRIADAFVSKRFLLHHIKPSMFHRRKSRSLQFNTGYREIYEFNEVAVARLHLVVLVQRGSDLLARDKNGTSDPVIQLSLSGEQMRQTSVISKNCYPEWNEVFTFGVRDVGAQQLIFDLYDYDPGKGNDFLGNVRLPLHRILYEGKLKLLRARKTRMLRQQELLENQSANTKRKTKHYGNLNNINPNANFRAHEVTGLFKNTEGMSHQVDMLMGSGAFEGAMFDLPLGYGPKHASKRRIGHKEIKGKIRIGAYLREFKLNDLDHENRDNNGEDNSGGGDEDNSNQKYQLYCYMYRAKDIRAKGIRGNLGNYVPGLHWMNRVKLKVEDLSVYSKYVRKTTGPAWNELLTMEVSDIQNKVVKVRCYQSGQAKLHNRFVGEVAIPLSLVQVVQSNDTLREAQVAAAAAAAGDTTSYTCSSSAAAGNGLGKSSEQNSDNGDNGDNGNTDDKSRTSSLGSLKGMTIRNLWSSSEEEDDAQNTSTVKPIELDTVLKNAISKDEILASVDPTHIPGPSAMPLKYTWGDTVGGGHYTEMNGEVMMAIWLIPTGGSLFGEIQEADIHSAPPEGEEKLIIPEALQNVVIDTIVPVPIDVLRRELWGRQDSPSMKIHLEEKLLKQIKIGTWQSENQENQENEKKEEQNPDLLRSVSSYHDGINGAMIRDVEYLLPASFGIAAMMVYEKQRIDLTEDVLGGFVVKISAQAPDVTYGKAIHTLTQFVHEWVGPRRTRIRISCEVKFGKGGPPGFIASQISSGSKKGGKDSAEMLIELLSTSGGGGGKKKKKKKKGGGIIWTVIKSVVVIVVIVLLAMMMWSFGTSSMTKVREGRQVFLETSIDTTTGSDVNTPKKMKWKKTENINIKKKNKRQRKKSKIQCVDKDDKVCSQHV